MALARVEPSSTACDADTSHSNLIVAGSITTAFELQAGSSCSAVHVGLVTALPSTSTPSPAAKEILMISSHLPCYLANLLSL